ncbi:Phosphoserine phosphatase RsbU [compost metagenome]
MPTKLQKAVFWITISVMAIYSAICVILAAGWLNRTFPGFMVLQNQSTDSLYSLRWSGIQAGVQVADHVVSMNGVPITSSEMLYRYAATKPVGTPITYEFERSGLSGVSKTVKMEIPTQKFAVWDLVGVWGSLWLMGFLHFLLGTFVSIVKPGDAAARAHLLFCMVFAAFSLSHFDSTSTYWFALFPHTVAFALVGTFSLDLALLVPRRLPILKRWPWIRPLNYALGALISIYVVAQYFIPEKFLMTYLVLTLYPSLAVAAIPATAIWANFSKTSTPLERSQARVILWGALFGFGPAVAVNLAMFLGVSFPGSELSYLAFTLFPLSIAYTIVRHKLFNIDVIIKRTITYTIVTSALLGLYFLMIGGVRMLIGEHSGLANILATVIVALAFSPMRDRTKSLVDRIFFRTGYDFQKIVTEFGDEARETLDSTQLLCAFIKRIEHALYPASIAILLRQQGADELHLKESLGLDPGTKFSLSVNDPKLALVGKTGKGIAWEPDDFGPIKRALVLPLLDKDDIIGCVLIGPRKSDLDYKEIDRLLLVNLAQQLSVWLKNTQLIGQVAGQERLKRELEIAAEVQAGLLPGKIPTLPGIELAALSKPALEVGGDFYDVIRVDENRLGILIGDVSGKGVPAALLMAMTLVIFRSIARGNDSAASVLAKANELIYLNRPSSKMFVTAFYAIYDARDNSLCFANAGNPFPIGTVGRLEAKGVSLGVLAKMNYEEQTITLNAGDTLVLYSDGAEDAMNSEREQFGEERVEQIITQNLGLSPNELQDRLLDEIHAFTGDGIPFDDITLVTLKTSA